VERSASTSSRKLDYKRELKELYGPRAGPPAIVDVPELTFLMVDGMGDPNTSRNYREAVEALFAISYRVKFAVKRSAGGIDYAVMLLEGLWWVDDMSTFSQRLHAFIAEAGYHPRGKHHEIYLSDPSRAEPAKLKTIVRQPIAPA
jgi:hypothetical protein